MRTDNEDKADSFIGYNEEVKTLPLNKNMDLDNNDCLGRGLHAQRQRLGEDLR